MIGEPALPVLADIWAKGFRGFDGDRALAEMVRTSSEDSGLSEWSIFDQFGFYPFDLVEGEAVSRSLEAGIGDDAVSRMATALSDPVTAERFSQRSRKWRNLIDPETLLARGKDSKGGWRTPFDPLKPTSPLNNPGDYTEGNAWQFTFTPGLFDPQGLKEALGGADSFASLLDQFFFELSTTQGAAYLGQEAMIGQYAHGNEPSHHIAWLYAYTDRASVGHRLIRQITNEFYSDAPGGIIGNEDAGQLSSWYVFATLGFYPLQPASATYVAGIPLVSKVTISVPGRKKLKILKQGTCENLVALTLDRRDLQPLAIKHNELIAGGVLKFKTS
jgi:predicted alpha-1,2-mannosidase